MTDDEHPDHEQLTELFHRAANSGPATAALDRLIYAHMLDRVTNGNLNVALEQFDNPGTIAAAAAEFEALDEDEREQLAAAVGPEWSEALSTAVELMWRACVRLGYDPDDLGGNHLALLASILLCDEGAAITGRPVA